jgi:hypothetical protein
VRENHISYHYSYDSYASMYVSTYEIVSHVESKCYDDGNTDR